MATKQIIFYSILFVATILSLWNVYRVVRKGIRDAKEDPIDFRKMLIKNHQK